MADFVSPVVDVILRLWSCCAKHTRYLCKLQENKDLLRNALEELTDLRNDVQIRVDEAEEDQNVPKMRTYQVRGWLQSVETTEKKVKEMLQKADEQQQLGRSGRCFGGCCPPSKKCWSNYKLGKSIAKKIPLVNELKGKGHFEKVAYNLTPESILFDKVWRLITSTATDDNKVVRIMGLYGKRSAGKTTLLEKINNEFNKSGSEQDHVVIFVVVSKPVNYEAIQIQIGENLSLSLQEDEDERRTQIFNVLRNKKFVILLDDIREKVDLQRIGIPNPLSQGNSSSKVIFTTQNKRVCRLMKATHKFRVDCVPWYKWWRQFPDNVGEEALTSFPRLLELVVKEHGDLPHSDIILFLVAIVVIVLVRVVLPLSDVILFLVAIVVIVLVIAHRTRI